jgi:hypothetical protein
VLLEGCAGGTGSGTGARAGAAADPRKAEIALLRYDEGSRLREARLGCPGDVRIVFDEYRKAGASRLPYRVSLREGEGRGRMVIRFRTVEANAKVSPTAFELRPPAGFLVLRPTEIAERFEEGLLRPPTGGSHR